MPIEVNIWLQFNGNRFVRVLGRFSMVDIPAVGIVSVSKRSALETSTRELSEDVSFGIGALLVAEKLSLENRPRGVCDTHRGVRYRYLFLVTLK